MKSTLPACGVKCPTLTPYFPLLPPPRPPMQLRKRATSVPSDSTSSAGWFSQVLGWSMMDASAQLSPPSRETRIAAGERGQDKRRGSQQQVVKVGMWSW